MNNYQSKIVGLSALLLSAQPYAATIFLTPSSNNLILGDSLSVDLHITEKGNHTAIGNYDFDVNFNPAVLNTNNSNVSISTQLQQSGIASLQNIGIKDGRLNISEVSLNDASILNSSQSDDLTVATLNFTATTAGTSPLGVSVNSLGDQDGKRIQGITQTPHVIRVHDLSQLSTLQVNSWRTLNSICGGNSDERLTENQRDLVNVSCRLTQDQELESQELGSALQNIAGEETITLANMAVRSVIQRSQMLRSRLALRRGNNNQAEDDEKLIGGGAGDDNSNLALSERLSGFVNASGSFGETDQTEREAGTHVNKEDITFGVDYQFNEQFVSGLAFTYANANANVQKSANVSGGKTAEHGYTGSIYSSYYVDDFYVDGVFSYTKRDYDIDRNIVIPSQNLRRKATADTESDQYSASFALGYNWHSHGFNVNPYAEASYSKLEIDSYSEKGAQGLNLNVEDQNIESLESVVGVQLTYAWSQPFGVVSPYVNAEWHHEFKEDVRAIKTSYVNNINSSKNILQLRNDSPDRDFATIGVGVSGIFKGGVQAFTAFETLVGQNNTSSYQFTAGVRLAF